MKAKSSVRKVFNTDPKKIHSNFCNLSPSEDILNSFLNNPKILKLSGNAYDIRICDGTVKVNESYKSLQLFESNKSPGNDGLTVVLVCSR